MLFKMNDRMKYQRRNENGYYVYYPDHEPHENWNSGMYGNRYANHSRKEAQRENEPYRKEEMAALMEQFLNENGQIDIQKTLYMAGQFADTIEQVTPVIKQLNDVFQGFRNKG